MVKEVGHCEAHSGVQARMDEGNRRFVEIAKRLERLEGMVVAVLVFIVITLGGVLWSARTAVLVRDRLDASNALTAAVDHSMVNRQN